MFMDGEEGGAGWLCVRKMVEQERACRANDVDISHLALKQLFHVIQFLLLNCWIVMQGQGSRRSAGLIKILRLKQKNCAAKFKLKTVCPKDDKSKSCFKA